MTADEIVAAARGWIGTPYHHQASVKGVGCDCLGLVRGVYEELRGRPAEAPPPYSRDWAEASATETMLEAARRHFVEIDPRLAGPGDVVIFRMRVGALAKHAGIMSVAPGGRPDQSPALVTAEFFGAPRLRAAVSPLGRGPQVPVFDGRRASARRASPLSRRPQVPGSEAGVYGHGSEAAGSSGVLGRPEEGSMRMIHAVEGAPVCEVHLNSWWRRRLAAAFRFPDKETPDAQPLPQP